jgi:hypothetical protein
VTPTEETALAQLRGLTRVTRIMDGAITIPGTGIRVGLDPVLGLIPGLGDVAGAALSGYVVLTAARMGAPAPLVARMLANVALDTAVGSVPLLGDLFDAGWKSNTRNVALLERHLGQPSGGAPGTRGGVIVVGLALLLLAAGGLFLTYMVVHAVFALLR